MHAHLLWDYLCLEFWPAAFGGAIHFFVIHNLIRIHVSKGIVQTLAPILG